MSPEGPRAVFGPADQALLSILRVQNEGLRGALCHLARRGVAFRRREPERAHAWIDVLGPHPMFKAGQFLFDLMEWEDFMLDGEPPADGEQQAAALIARLRALLGLGALAVSMVVEAGETLPDLEAGFYLYRDVVLGGLAVDLAGVGFATSP